MTSAQGTSTGDGEEQYRNLEETEVIWKELLRRQLGSTVLFPLYLEGTKLGNEWRVSIPTASFRPSPPRGPTWRIIMSSPVQLWSLPCPSPGTYQVCLLPHHLLPHNQAVLGLLPHKQRRPSLQRGFYRVHFIAASLGGSPWSNHSFFVPSSLPSQQSCSLSHLSWSETAHG